MDGGEEGAVVPAAFAGGWPEEAAAAVTGVTEWRLPHPRATLSEIEAALDERWAVASSPPDCR